MADIDRILSKIDKLLRLSKSDNVNEAAAAAARAQDLMDRYQLKMCDVEGIEQELKDPIEDRGVVHDMGATYNQWVLNLVKLLAKQNHCKIYLTSTHYHKDEYRRQKRQQIAIVGRKADFQIVSYMTLYLRKEVKRLCNQDCFGMSQTFRKNYMEGCVEEIGSLLKISRDAMKKSMQSEVSSTAMVRFDNRIKEVGSWMDSNMNLVSGKARRQLSGNDTARAMGAVAAHSINLSAGAGALPAPRKKIR